MKVVLILLLAAQPVAHAGEAQCPKFYPWQDTAIDETPHPEAFRHFPNLQTPHPDDLKHLMPKLQNGEEAG